jgi:hypothetical protein
MFKELEHWTQFSNLVHYNEVTDLYVLYIHASSYRFSYAGQAVIYQLYFWC